MMRKHKQQFTVRLFLLGWVLLCISPWVLPCMAAASNTPPNFIIVFADDQGYQDLSCYGSTTIKTPNIDRLAAEGMRFTDFYVPAPICTPSRAALMTGCYPCRIGMARGVLRPDSRKGLNPSEITLARLLSKRGYVTGAVGKWHLGFVGPFRPTRHGFDFYYGLYHNLDHWETKHFDDNGGPPLLRNEEVEQRPATPEILVDLYTREATAFIRRNREKPFFLYLAHQMPHVPLGVPPERKGRSAGGLYGDVIEHLDWSTGQIIQTLRELGIERQTIVIYTSDNGPSPLATGSAAPLRGRKHQTFEGGMRVPFIAWGPGQIPSKTICRKLATSMDLYPTLAQLAGAPLPTDRIIDGRDISPLLTGRPGAKSPHGAFFYHNGRGQLLAVRAGKWKLHLGDKPALYQLHTDIGEQNNLIVQHPDIVTRLQKMAATFETEIQKHSRPIGNLDKKMSN